MPDWLVTYTADIPFIMKLSNDIDLTSQNKDLTTSKRTVTSALTVLQILLKKRKLEVSPTKKQLSWFHLC